ncbi:MAG: SH3 domain-containing protein [Spirochaetaceae bacterium]|jgi:hypothetical protein|nr:SH3 domain-containing protein [Spirochaetaceae bacterium]
MSHKKNPVFFLTVFFLLSVLCASCQRKLGWGVLLWTNEETGIPSGTVLPVYVKSNIEKKWIVGVPKAFRKKDFKEDKLEIPLAQLELSGSRGGAKRYAAEFAEYALKYAETLQDGLPIRSSPDNSAARVYRLRIGEIIKIISIAEGAPAISATGDPLPGSWYRILTADGTRGYCFSYRLRLFDHTTGPLNAGQSGSGTVEDSLLQTVQAKVWSAHVYYTMLSSGKFDIDALSKRWGFSTGEDTGIATVYTSDIDRSFQYTVIRSVGERTWRFDGTSLTMTLVSDNNLTVRFIDNDGMAVTADFAALPVSVDDLINQEKNRRDSLYAGLYAVGREFSSAMFGHLTLTEEADFLWDEFEMLVPDYIPVSALGRGKVEIRYNISDELTEFYNGVLSFRFKTIGGADRTVNFLYKINSEIETNGTLILEYISPEKIHDGIVASKGNDALVIYFFKVD